MCNIYHNNIRQVLRAHTVVSVGLPLLGDQLLSVLTKIGQYSLYFIHTFTLKESSFQYL